MRIKIVLFFRFMFLVVILLSMLSGCAPTEVKQYSAPVNDSGMDSRIVVVSSTRYIDARGDSRFIMVIKDNNTGNEFLAIEGAGVQRIYTECHIVNKETVCNNVEK
jgi:hypothetical protein